MGALKPGDQVMVERDPYDETSPSGYATVIRVHADYQQVDVQFEPVTVSDDRVHPRPEPGGR